MKKKIMAAVISMTLVLACVPAALADCPPHTFDYWVTTLEPTCTHVGQKKAKCQECGVLYGPLEPIPALGHTAGDWEVVFEPTRDLIGMRIKKCIRCHIVMEAQEMPRLTGDVTNSIACSQGPRFQENRPGLTDKWYMYTPLDLSVEGARTIPLIATNHYIIGSVAVTTAGGNVQVDYHLNSAKVHIRKEFMTFFPDLASIKTVDPKALEAQNFPFNTAIDIQGNLAGDTSVLLYIALSVDYNYFASGIKPYSGAAQEEESDNTDNGFIPPAVDVSDLSRYQTLTVGTAHSDVTKLKLRLYELGYYQRVNEGQLYTDATAATVKAFQQANGLKADGIATPETQVVLYSDQAVPCK